MCSFHVCPVCCPLLFVFVCCALSSMTSWLLTEHAYTYKVNNNLIPEHPYSEWMRGVLKVRWKLALTLHVILWTDFINTHEHRHAQYYFCNHYLYWGICPCRKLLPQWRNLKVHGAGWLLLQHKAYREAQLPLQRWVGECFCNMLGRLREAIQRKKLGQFCFEGIFHHDSCISHTFQVTTGVSSMDEKWCSIYHAVQSWYPQT